MVRNLRRNLEALFCPHLKVSVCKFDKFAPPAGFGEVWSRFVASNTVGGDFQSRFDKSTVQAQEMKQGLGILSRREWTEKKSL